MSSMKNRNIHRSGIGYCVLRLFTIANTYDTSHTIHNENSVYERSRGNLLS